jgi:hypothetical protein
LDHRSNVNVSVLFIILECIKYYTMDGDYVHLLPKLLLHSVNLPKFSGLTDGLIILIEASKSLNNSDRTSSGRMLLSCAGPISRIGPIAII